MADYKQRFEEWQRAAQDKFEEIDKQFGLKDRFEEGTKLVKDVAEKGAETFKDGVEKIKTEAEKTEVGKQAVKVAEDTVKTAGETAQKFYQASEPIRDVAEDAGEKAGEVFKTASEKASDVFGVTADSAEKVVKEAGKRAGEVFSVASEKAGEVFDDASATFKKTTKTASSIFNFGSSWAKTFDSAYKTFSQTTEWIQENPLQAATTGVSMVIGAGVGVVVTGLSSHWLFNSSIPAWTVKKAGEYFNDYLKGQEDLISKGELSEAESERIKFERDIVKRVGAPLLGAYSFASGAVMMTNILNPKTITGAPLDWLLGGNPLLEGVWFFGNGMVCFKTSYDFFMIALDDHDDVQKMVKEIKGMLPNVATES